MQHDMRQIGVKVLLKPDARSICLSLVETKHGFNIVVQRARSHVEISHAGKSQEIPKQVFESIALLANHVDFCNRSALPRPLDFHKLFAEQVRIHVNYGKRILNLMCQRTS